MYADQVPSADPSELHFWERRSFVFALAVFALVPLLWPGVPPLLDLPGHMGRYQVQMYLDTSPHLQQFYTFEWRLIGNLGVDLLVHVLAPVIGLEPAVKLIVLTIPVVTVGGMLWVAREVHGRVPPTALFAVPFAYSFPFLFGFVNFALAMAMALNAFALWLRLARLGRTGLRAAVFLPFAPLLWVVHAFGWGTLGVLAFSAELVRQFDKGRPFYIAPVRAGVHCLSLCLPFLLMVAWRSDASGRTADYFNWERKWDWLVMALRDRWEWFDIGSVALVALLLVWTVFSRRMTFSRNLLASVIFLSIVFVLLPRIVFGSAYADMRLAPYLFVMALIAIRMRPGASERFVQVLAVIGFMFVSVRLGANTASFILYDRVYDRELAALNHLPRGARVVSFAGRPCREPWAMSRILHLPGMAIVRRDAFSNDQWTMEGAQLLSVNYPQGWPFIRDPFQQVTYRRCGREFWPTIHGALARFNRDAFDYVWLMRPPPHDRALLRGLTPIWRDGSSVLYRVDDRTPPA